MRKLYILIIIAVITRLCLLLTIHHDLSMNDDEYVNYLTALNHHQGNGYTLYHPEKNAYVATAFHGSFPIFIYEGMIRFNIGKDAWVLFIYACCIFFYALSIYCFFRISLSFLKHEKFAFYTTIVYAFYPSIAFYIGTVFLYENIALPLLVIVVYRLFKSFGNPFTKTDYLLIPAAVSISCLLRPQTIVVYAFVFAAYALFILQKKQYRHVPLLLITLLTASVLHVPMLVKNKALFGKYILSTQPGYEFSQGHNPTAQGSWNGFWRDPNNDFYKYAHRQISDLDSLDELQESEARKEEAVKWIKNNPGSELRLCAKKTVIYLLPLNSDSGLAGSGIINPVNLMVHLFFIGCMCMMLYKRSAGATEWLLLSPFIASLFLSLVFFVGYRWRYYAEPFMIIFAWKYITVLYQRFYGQQNRSK